MMTPGPEITGDWCIELSAAALRPDGQIRLYHGKLWRRESQPRVTVPEVVSWVVVDDNLDASRGATTEDIRRKAQHVAGEILKNEALAALPSEFIPLEGPPIDAPAYIDLTELPAGAGLADVVELAGRVPREGDTVAMIISDGEMVPLESCARCGKGLLPEDTARFDDLPYCHHRDSVGDTCYMLTSQERSAFAGTGLPFSATDEPVVLEVEDPSRDSVDELEQPQPEPIGVIEPEPLS